MATREEKLKFLREAIKTLDEMIGDKVEEFIKQDPIFKDLLERSFMAEKLLKELEDGDT